MQHKMQTAFIFLKLLSKFFLYVLIFAHALLKFSRCACCTHFNIIFIFLARNVALKHFKHILFTSQCLFPHGLQLLWFGIASQVKQIVIFQFPKRRTRRISPSAVRKLVPRLCSINITLWTRTPEYRSDVFR